jgi:hypothetical protein
MLGASPKEMPSRLIVAARLKKWDPYSPDTGGNATRRRTAQRAMDDYYEATRARTRRRSTSCSGVLVGRHAPGRASERADKWWQNTIARSIAGSASLPRRRQEHGARLAGSEDGGRGRVHMLDREIERSSTTRPGTTASRARRSRSIKQYTAQRRREGLVRQAAARVDAYVSPEWTIAAVSRQGSLYDSLRTGLYNVRRPR